MPSKKSKNKKERRCKKCGNKCKWKNGKWVHKNFKTHEAVV